MRLRSLGLSFLLLSLSSFGAVIGTLVPYEGISERDISKLPEPQRTGWQQYLARSTAEQRREMAILAGERLGLAAIPASPADSMHDGSMPLDKPASWYASDEARHIADVIVSFQTPSGGWGKNQDFSGELRKKGQMWVIGGDAAPVGDIGNRGNARWHFVGTIDNDATTTQLKFLAKVIARAGDKDASVWRASFLKGIDYLMNAEFPGGGWPQVWPLEGGYHDALTYNDNATANVVAALAQVAANSDNLYSFVPADTRLKSAAAVKRTVNIVLKTQVRVNDKRTIWGQQYNALTHSLTPARNYEPAVLSAAESTSLLLFLMSDPNPSPEIIQAVRDGIATLKALAIKDRAWVKTDGRHRLVNAPGAQLWARYYDPNTMKPVFGDRDKTIHDTTDELSPERREGYSWYNTVPSRALEAYAKWEVAHPQN
jgi:PelA/Pel-15E family pectate lyase